jgi:hypothetical protein
VVKVAETLAVVVIVVVIVVVMVFGTRVVVVLGLANLKRPFFPQ